MRGRRIVSPDHRHRRVCSDEGAVKLKTGHFFKRKPKAPGSAG